MAIGATIGRMEEWNPDNYREESWKKGKGKHAKTLSYRRKRKSQHG